MSEDPNAHLITRDPEQMDRQPKDADYAGAEPQDGMDGLDSGLLEVRAGNVGGLTQVPLDPARGTDLNPGYTPPSQMESPHPSEGAADLPRGAPAEAGLEDDLGDRR